MRRRRFWDYHASERSRRRDRPIVAPSYRSPQPDATAMLRRPSGRFVLSYRLFMAISGAPSSFYRVPHHTKKRRFLPPITQYRWRTREQFLLSCRPLMAFSGTRPCFWRVPHHSEGKTFCATNYAVSLAQQGLRVLLIDADLRLPSLEKCLALRRKHLESRIALRATCVWGRA